MSKCYENAEYLYSGQHWRDVVLTPDELYLDLLSYSGDLIKLSSFTEYNDKLKASAAFVNRVLPPELSLNLSQKCLFLVEGKKITLLRKQSFDHMIGSRDIVEIRVEIFRAGQM